MRRIEPAHAVFAQSNRFTVRESAGTPISKILN
jgi:hypothetical protein